MDSTRETIGSALGRVPSGCAIMTAQAEGRATGMLVSWTQQAAFDPPSLTVALKRGRPIATLLASSRRFALNLLGDDPTAMFRHFGRGFGPDEDAFAGVAVTPSEFGPTLAVAIACLGCRVVDSLAVGDHDLYVAEVVSASAVANAKPYVHTRKSGLSY